MGDNVSELDNGTYEVLTHFASYRYSAVNWRNYRHQHMRVVRNKMVRCWALHNIGWTHSAVLRQNHARVSWSCHLVYKKAARCLVSYNTVSSRVISATFAAKPRDITIGQCYAPTADKPEEEIEQFYKEMEHVLAETPKRNVVLITGDFNARVGENAIESDVLGKFSR